MFRKIKSETEMATILEWLKHKKPASIKAFGHLKAVVDGLLDCNVFVNSTTDLRSIVISNGSKAPEFIQKAYTVFTTDLDDLNQLLLNAEFIDWSRRILFGGVSVEYLEILQNHAKRWNGALELELCKILHCTCPSIKRKPQDFVTVRRLTVAEAELVNSEWKFSAETSLDYVKFLIRNAPSICAVDTRSNALAAWVLVQHYGAIGMLHVLPEYRGQGLAQYLVQRLTDELVSRGLSAYTFIEIDNEVSIRVFEKSGFLSGNTDVCFAVFTPK